MGSGLGLGFESLHRRVAAAIAVRDQVMVLGRFEGFRIRTLKPLPCKTHTLACRLPQAHVLQTALAKHLDTKNTATKSRHLIRVLSSCVVLGGASAA